MEVFAPPLLVLRQLTGVSGIVVILYSAYCKGNQVGCLKYLSEISVCRFKLAINVVFLELRVSAWPNVSYMNLKSF